MKTYAELIAKADELAAFPVGTAEHEGHLILKDMAGKNETDMCNREEAMNILLPLEREGGVTERAALLVAQFLSL